MKLDIKDKKFQFFSGLVLILLIIVLISVLIGNRQGIEYVESPSAEIVSGRFSFLGVGADTQLTKAIRKSLSDKLGSDTVERFGTIDLSLNYKGFLKQYFPDLFALNNSLNDQAGPRVEHDTLNIAFRYPPKGETPFDYVKLIFSDHTKKPLLILIKAEQEGSPILATLAEKYGPPDVVQWENKQGISHYWRQAKNVLIASLYEDRIGQPELQISIYFVDSIDELLSMERKEASNQEGSRKQNGKSAF